MLKRGMCIIYSAQFAHACIYSLICLATYPTIYHPIHSSIYSSIHSSTSPTSTHPSIHPSFYPSTIHPSVHPSTHPFTHPPIHPSTQPARHLSIHPSSQPASQLSMHLTIHPSIYPHICSSNHSSILPSTQSYMSQVFIEKLIHAQHHGYSIEKQKYIPNQEDSSQWRDTNSKMRAGQLFPHSWGWTGTFGDNSDLSRWPPGPLSHCQTIPLEAGEARSMASSFWLIWGK